jgi:hypothetical protein
MTNEDEMTITPKLTTTAACRVARVDRDRFNEDVAAGYFNCAPKTVPGRARLFAPNDMLALCLYREFLDGGYNKERAGKVACEVARAAHEAPEADVITYVESYGPGDGYAFPASQVLASGSWAAETFLGGTLRAAHTYNVGHMRKLIEQSTEEERSIIGPDD